MKTGPDPATEAAMLRALAASGVPTSRVLGVSDEILVIEPLPTGGQLSGAWASLGAILATLHQSRGECYGWPQDYAFGPVSIRNAWSEDWPGFWAERRLLIHAGHVPPDLTRRIETMATRLVDRLPARPPPVLLHGDLWSGNILSREDQITGLIDPACYYGHNEVDLAMLKLFDQPSRAFEAAYGPLDAGDEDRLPIYQLWPALVHLRLFGSSYRGLVERLLAAAGV